MGLPQESVCFVLDMEAVGTEEVWHPVIPKCLSFSLVRPEETRIYLLENLPVVLCCTVSLCLFQDYCGMAWSVLAQRFKNGLFSSHADEHRLK